MDFVHPLTPSPGPDKADCDGQGQLDTCFIAWYIGNDFNLFQMAIRAKPVPVEAPV